MFDCQNDDEAMDFGFSRLHPFTLFSDKAIELLSDFPSSTEVPCIRTCTDWAWKELWSLAVKTTELQIDKEPLDVRGTHIQVH